MNAIKTLLQSFVSLYHSHNMSYAISWRGVMLVVTL